MRLTIKDGRAKVEAQTDWNEFNTKLAKLMKKLKKDAGAQSLKQNYKGTGRQKARRQLWVRFKSGAVIDLWIDMGYLGLGGVVTNRPPGSDVTLSTKKIPYGNKTPEQVYDEAVKVLNPWANPKYDSGGSGGLSKSDLKKGAQIVQPQHPEYGTWTILGPAKGASGMWEIKNRRGEKVVDEDELLNPKFWAKA